MTDGVDDDDYLNGVASDLMIGIGSIEDDLAMVAALERAGFRSEIVYRLHSAIVNAEVRNPRAIKPSVDKAQAAKARALDWMLDNDVSLFRVDDPALKRKGWRAKWVRQDGVMAFGPAKPTAEEAILAAMELGL